MSIHLVRPGEMIGETGQVFTPGKMAQAWIYNADLVEANIGSGGSGLASEIDFFGNGRRVKDDFTLYAPHATLSPSLGIVLPESAVIRIDGVDYVVDSDTTLLGAPASTTSYCVPSVTYDSVSESYVWSATWPTTRPALGTGVLATVVTDGTHVTSIASGEADADIIPWMPVVYSRIRSLIAGSGGGGSTPYLSTIEVSADDSTTGLVKIQAMLDALQALLEAEIAAGGKRPRKTHDDQIMHELAITRQLAIRLGTLSSVTLNDAERTQSANVVERADGSIYGNGTGGHPNHIDTELTLNSDGTIEP